MARQTDILVIGAGPGGCAAALQMKKLGHDPLVVDKAVFPRDKICGDAISGKVVEVLNRIDPSIVSELQLQEYQLGSWGVTFVAPNGRSLRVPFKTDYDPNREYAPGMIAKRMDFDNFLVEKVKAAGVEVKEGFAVKDTQQPDGKNGPWLVTGKSGEQIEARILIVANGAQSALSKSLAGMRKVPAHYCAGIRAYYKGVEGMEQDQFIELHFLRDFLPGYFWIFPLPNGWANVGVGMRSDKVSKKRVNLKRALLELVATHPALKERFAHAELQGDIKGFGLPLGSMKRPLSGHGFMLTGDAASLIDPFTGEGIGNAMVSGVAAAERASEAIDQGDVSGAFLQAYDQEVYRKLGSELQLSHRMQQLVNYPWLFNLVVNKANKNKTLQETISCMFEDLDMRKRLRQPSFYWGLLFG